MATLGRREMTNKKERSGHSEVPAWGLAVQAVNLNVIIPRIQLVAMPSVQPSFLGGPIMREDFITTTGVMPPRFA
jgi:hypothetical protein